MPQTPRRRADKLAISPARLAAFQVLMRVETEEAYSSELLHSEKVSKLSQLDRNLAMQITMGVLRWQSRLDDAISKFATGRNAVSKLDPEVRIALRMAAFQAQLLDRIPASAAVNDSVDLVKRAGKRSAAPFVNAVLRKLAASPTEVPKDPTSSREMADVFAHPLWMVERWVNSFGMEKTHRLCEANQSLPVTTLRLPLDRAAAEAIETELNNEGITIAPGEWVVNARHVITGDVTATRAYREKRIAIQDEASQLVAALVGKGERILDCCAAPGGKTAAIAQRNPNAEIIAVEVYEQRARVMRKLITASNVEVVNADIVNLPINKTFDRVLADVPCSGTGTLARNPEIKWRVTPDDLRDLHQKQVAILTSALARDSDGGRVIYATCSLEAEENEQVVEEVLRANKQLRLLEVKTILRELPQDGALALSDFGSITSGPYLRTIPGTHPCDGFFAAVLEKVSG